MVYHDEICEYSRGIMMHQTALMMIDGIDDSYLVYAIDSEKQRDVMIRSEEHTSELQSLMRISYAVFCLKKKKKNIIHKDQKKLKHQIRSHTYIITRVIK